MRQKEIYEYVNDLGRVESEGIGVNNVREYEISNEVRLLCYVGSLSKFADTRDDKVIIIDIGIACQKICT